MNCSRDNQIDSFFWFVRTRTWQQNKLKQQKEFTGSTTTRQPWIFCEPQCEFMSGNKKNWKVEERKKHQKNKENEFGGLFLFWHKRLSVEINKQESKRPFFVGGCNLLCFVGVVFFFFATHKKETMNFVVCFFVFVGTLNFSILSWLFCWLVLWVWDHESEEKWIKTSFFAIIFERLTYFLVLGRIIFVFEKKQNNK